MVGTVLGAVEGAVEEVLLAMGEDSCAMEDDDGGDDKAKKGCVSAGRASLTVLRKRR